MTPEQKKEVDRSRAYGMLHGALDAVSMQYGTATKERIQELLKRADELWNEYNEVTPAKATTR